MAPTGDLLLENMARTPAIYRACAICGSEFRSRRGTKVCPKKACQRENKSRKMIERHREAATGLRTCRSCGAQKPLAEYVRHSRPTYERRCRECRNAAQRALTNRRRDVYPRHKCWTPECERMIRRSHYCGGCRNARQAEAAEQSPPPGLDQCGLVIHGKACALYIRDGSDFLGRATVTCPQHGERLVTMVRPVGFVRYDQRETLEAELTGNVESAQRAVDPDAAQRSRGRTKITIERTGNFLVGDGRAA